MYVVRVSCAFKLFDYKSIKVYFAENSMHLANVRRSDAFTFFNNFKTLFFGIFMNVIALRRKVGYASSFRLGQ